MSNRYAVVVQARCNSSRLPAKVLADVCGQPMLARQLRRLQKKLTIPKLIVATTKREDDDNIEKLCNQLDIPCFRGETDNVLKRFIDCAAQYDYDYFIRVGGDDPLIDVDCCNHLYQLHKLNPIDFLYASNKDGWPYGMAAELISIEALKKIATTTNEPLYLEHTIPYFFDNPSLFTMHRVVAPDQLKHSNQYFTVDYPQDLEFVRTIFRELENLGDYFTSQNVLDLLASKPELSAINHHLHQGFDH